MITEASKTATIPRTSSIEKEPMTLHHDQLRFAREAALYVLNTRSTEEAWTIFTKGLEPVICAKIKTKGNGYGDDADFQEIGASTVQSRDVATAPF